MCRIPEVTMRNLRYLLFTAATGLVIACTDAALPTQSGTSSPNFDRASQENSEQQRRHELLKALLQEQKHRIKEQKKLGQAEFEQARTAWKFYRQKLKRGRNAKLKQFELLRCEPRPYE